MGAPLVLIAFLLGFLAWPWLRARSAALPGWLGSSGTAFLLLAALLAGIEAFAISRTSWLHRWDLFHTMIGTKYFAELGYDRLYECTIVFGREELGMFADVRRVRDLETLRYVSAANLVAQSDCGERFTPGRKAELVSDLAVFRSMMSPRHWRRLFLDKGYNGPPFHSFLASSVARIVPFSRESFLWLSLVDLALLAGGFSLAWRAFGPRVVLVAFVFFCVNYPARFIHMGGSFLRYDYVALLIAGFALLRLERFRAAAVCLALASMVRIFPMVFAAGLFARHAMDWVRLRRIPRGHRVLLAVFAATMGVAFLLSISHGRGIGNWAAFVDNLRVHTQRSAGFRVGLDHLYVAGGEVTGADVAVDFRARGRELERMRPLRWLVLALLAVPAAVAMRRLDAAGAAILSGALAMFVLFQATRYYYSILVLLCFVDSRPREAGELPATWRLTAGLLFLVSAAGPVAERWEVPTPLLYNDVLSGLLFLFFATILAVHVREAARPGVAAVRPATAVGALVSLALAVVVVGGCFAWSVAKAPRPPGMASTALDQDGVPAASG